MEVEKVNALKSILILVIVMSIFTLLIVPMEAGSFPSWLDTDFVQFMLIVLLVASVLILIR